MVRTFIIFDDELMHCEHSIGMAPILPVGGVMRVRTILFSEPTKLDPRRTEKKKIDADFRIGSAKLIYSTLDPSRMGLSQYLELSRVDQD